MCLSFRGFLLYGIYGSRDRDIVGVVNGDGVGVNGTGEGEVDEGIGVNGTVDGIYGSADGEVDEGIGVNGTVDGVGFESRVLRASKIN